MLPSHIYENDKGVICFDRYFEYLRKIAQGMPGPLAVFAMDPGRYELNGPRTLHDGWLKSLNVIKEYGDPECTVNTSVYIGLRLPTNGAILTLSYFGVLQLQTTLEPTRWPIRPVDLLVHEFTQKNSGEFQHLLQFDRGVGIRVTFTSFECA